MKAGVLFVALMLVFLSVSSLNVISRTRDYLLDDSEKKLLKLSDQVSKEINSRYSDAVKDQYYLYSIYVRESLADLVLIDKEGRVIIGALPSRKQGSTYNDGWLTPVIYSEVWQGKTRVSPLFKREGRTVRSVCFPVSGGLGRAEAVGVATLDVNYIDELTQQGSTYIFLKSLASVFLLLVIFYLIKALIQSEKSMLGVVKGTGGSGGRYESGDNTTFMVDAFHSMVGQLKEKERELKDLKEKAEVRARSMESYNENILRNIQSGVITFDRDGHVRTANHAAESILGVIPGSADGKGAEDLFGKGNWVPGLVARTLAEGKPERRAEGEVAVSDKSGRWVGAGTSPLIGDDGGIEGVVLVFTDITEVKELKERMELKERLTLLGEMSAGIAHELRNPMGVISGYADLLARRLKDDEASMGATRSIHAEIKVMDEIISEFMNFSQPTELNVTEVDTKGLVEDALKSLPWIDKSIIREVVLDDGLPPVEGDAVLLRQAFANIIKNAAEAMPDGGRLSVSARLVEAGKGDPPGGVMLPGYRYINIEVSDTGMGIFEKDLRKIFTPFFTTKEKGTGLGLALVQKILVYHGGRATVNSTQGKGTTFNVYLPASTPGKAAG